MNITHKDLKYWAWPIVGVLSLVLIFLCFQLVREYRHNARAETISSEHATFVSLLSHHAPLTIADTSYIQTWMTFDYVNTIYKLPSTYLQTALAITDAPYPHISIVRYARAQKIPAQTFLSQVKTAVGEYGTSTSSPSSLATSTISH